MPPPTYADLAPPPWSNTVRLLLVDTNVLRKDVLRRVRLLHGSPGRMLGATGGSLRILVPRHVPQEMDAKVGEFARTDGLSVDVARRVWLNEYRPKLTVVDVSDLVEVLATHPLVAATLARDPDDAPLACLAVLLGQPALSEDADLGLAGTGRPWLNYLIAVTDAVLSDNTTGAVAWGGVAAASGVYRSARGVYAWLERTVGSVGAALIAVALAGAVMMALTNDRSRRWIAATPPVRAAGKGMAAFGARTKDVLIRADQAESFLRAAALPDDEGLPPVASLFRLLARAAVPQTAAQLATRLGWDRTAVELMLDAHTAFVPTPDSRWQLGFALPHRLPQEATSGVPVAPTLRTGAPLRYSTPWASQREYNGDARSPLSPPRQTSPPPSNPQSW